MATRSLRRRFLSWALRHPSWYPPFIAAGIRVVEANPQDGVYRVRMKLRFYNRNALGTHFGGSLYAMCDPWYALILIEQLGPSYTVWDKSASIEFLRPGRGMVSAEFRLPEHQVAEIKAAADSGQVVEPVLRAEVIDSSGDAVARVTKELHVRRRPREQ